MTTPEPGSLPRPLPDDATAVLVRGPRPTRSAVDRVTLGPRLWATCDGERWRLPVVVRVVAGGEDCREQYPRERLQSAVRAVAGAVHERGVREIWFYRPRQFRNYWPARSVARLEERLVGVARGSGGRVVTWTDSDGRDHRTGGYDVVVD